MPSPSGSTPIGPTRASSRGEAGSHAEERAAGGELRRLADEQSALRRVAEIAARGAEPDAVFARVASEASALLGDEAITLVRFEGESELVVVAVSGGPAPLGRRIGFEAETLPDRVRRRAEPVRVDDYSVERDARLAVEYGLAAAVGAPIAVEGRVWGMLTATSQEAPLPPGTERRLQQFAEIIAAAIAGAQARGELRSLADEQAALRRVAELVAGGSSQNEVLDLVVGETARLMGVGFIALVRYEPDGSWVIAAEHGAPDELKAGYHGPAEVDGVVRRVRRTGRPVHIDNFEGLAGAGAELARRLGFSAAAGAPILIERRIWGALTATALRGSLPAAIERRLAQFAGLVATAISGTQARSALRELADEQAALRRVAELVARGVAPQRLFDSVAVEASKLIEDEATTLLRIDDGRTYTVVASRDGPAPPGTRIEVAPDDEGVVAEILRTRRPARVDDYGARPGPAYARDDYGVGSSVGVPIIVEDRIWGILGATTRQRQLPAVSEHRLQQFAELVAAAIGNAQARAQVQRLADEQTALRHVAELVAGGALLEEVFAAVADEASKLLGDLAAALLRYDPDGFATNVAACNSPAPLGLRVPSHADSATGQLLRTGRPVRVDSFEGTPLEAIARELGVGAGVAVPVVVEGRVWGALTTSTPDVPPPAGTEDRLAQFAKLAAAAIANAENKRKLIASRARVFATADETRRRVQRDVHDGAQQRLVSTLIALKLAKHAAAGGGPTAPLIDEALRHAERATDELRDLVRGILPASLTRGGLRPGLESLVADTAVPVDLDVTAERLPAEVETTAYFIVAEALTNVVKHAAASRASVRLAVTGEQLVIEVRDDGSGGADPAGGTGLTGLSDRVEVSDGTLAITSPPGRGTVVRATLPVDVPGAAG